MRGGRYDRRGGRTTSVIRLPSLVEGKGHCACSGSRVRFVAVRALALLAACVLLFIPLHVSPARAQTQELQALFERGYELYTTGKYAEAIPVAEEYIALAKARFGESHLEYAKGLSYLAVLYGALNRLNDAELLFKQALTVHEKARGPIAEALHSLAELYKAQGRLTEAEPIYLRALAMAEEAESPDHLDLAVILINLAALYQSQSRYLDAEPLLKRSLAIREKARLGSR